eukprot:TRINITY_DN12728_c0_g1_i1.p1 TRINITY_DN12728_c0_g1~~TRINITY_DN12728_c0_g1_i1.p1  ORF type:complete len:290 (+),score=63.80 TRINITY_DN12728_c0_g1_i1:118-987(+)
MDQDAASQEFVLLGAGLPRTGTLSTKAALGILLGGPCYHMASVLESGRDHQHWRRAILGQATEEDWRKVLEKQGYRAGVDYPVSVFYKEIMEAYPDAKVLLNVRDPVKWYHSVKNSIFKLNKTATTFPCSWFLRLINSYDGVELAKQICYTVPQGSALGLSMFEAIENGEETAVKFWNNHVEEVKRVVPADKLLIFEVKEGWGPLCKFLEVSTPSVPFPNENDSDQIEISRKELMRSSWSIVVFLPLLALTGLLFLDSSGSMALAILFLSGCIICYKSSEVHHLKHKQL